MKGGSRKRANTKEFTHASSSSVCFFVLLCSMLSLEQSVLLSMSDVVQWRSESTLDQVHQSVFIGRVCHELKQKQLMSLDTLLATTTTAAPAPAPASTPRSAASVHAHANATGSNQIHLSLSITAKTAFRIWTRYIAAVLSEDFVQELELWIVAQKAMQAQGPKHSEQYFQQLFSSQFAKQRRPHSMRALPYAGL